MSTPKHFTLEQAHKIGATLGLEWDRFDAEQFHRALELELQHGLHDTATDVTGDDPILTSKIALAHLNELAVYYTPLARMEQEAKEQLP